MFKQVPFPTCSEVQGLEGFGADKEGSVVGGKAGLTFCRGTASGITG